MSAATIGVQGHCAHCGSTLLLKPWQLNAIAINEAFTCSHCEKALQLNDPKQIKRFKSLDSLAWLRASTLIMVCTTLLVALVLEWIGILSVIEQLNFSLLAIFVYFIVMRFARHRQHLTLTLEAAKAYVN
jgi:DNA-directed RNA polymerase subunit RPC12/RpoP